MRWNVPNMLTVARLLAAPAFALCFAIFARPFADILALVLFIVASLTDFLDGYLARRWGQVSAFGRMLDPIADKAMVIIALAVLLGLSGMNPLVVIPAALILFREVFVSGLREFLGADAGRLKVTGLAKWKTTVQMVAVIVLLVAGAFQLWMEQIYYSMDPARFEAVLAGTADDPNGLVLTAAACDGAQIAGVILLWLAGILTLISGLDYFRKALPFLAESEGS